MVTSFGLLACLLTLGQSSDRTELHLGPHLTTGQEFVYKGTYTEEALIPNVQYQHQYRLETQILVLGAGKRSWNIAVMTTLALRDSRQEKGPNVNPGPGPTSVRLEMLQVDSQG